MKLSSLFSTMIFSKIFSKKILHPSLSLFLFFLILFSSLNLQVSYAQTTNADRNNARACPPGDLSPACRGARGTTPDEQKAFDESVARGAQSNAELNPVSEKRKQCEQDPTKMWNSVSCVDRGVGWTKCVPGYGSVAECLSYLADTIFGFIFGLVNQVLSYVLGFATWLLDVVVYATVVKFRSNISDLNLKVEGSVGGFPVSTGNIGSALLGNGKEDLIYYLWGILRDFVNLLLLITIIYYAVRTMFDGFDQHNKKFIYLLLFSIVINFSLFFVKFAIDISNILTLQAYTLTVNPTGFDTWDNFRKRAKDNPPQPATIGEYLINVANYGKLFDQGVSKDAANERIFKGMQNSWVFQLGVIIMNLCLIYLVFFLIGMLVMRAIALLMAMILAALLAADIFFGVVKGGKDIEFAANISEYTKNIKGDFYEALVKGPLLFLFLFLTGVLANAIFTNGIAAQVTGLAQESGEFKILGTAFGASLAVLLKFAVFFALAKVILDKINKISFVTGKSPFMKYGKSIANFGMKNTVGRLAGGAGWVGRNTIGRGLNTFREGRMKTLEANTKKYDDRIKSGNLVTSNWAKAMQTWNDRSLKVATERKEKGFLTAGSYDGRALVKGESRIAKSIRELTGAKGDELGDSTKGGYAAEKKRKDEEIAKRDKDRQTRIDKVEEDNFDEDSDEFKKKVKEIKVDFAGDKYSQAEIEDAIKAHEKEPASNAISIGAKKNIISASDREKYFKGKDGKLSDADSAKYAIGSEKERIKTKIIADKQKARAQQERIQLAQQIDTKEGAKARRELGATYADKTEKDKKKRAAQIQTIRDINDGLKQVKSELEKAGEVEGKENLYKDNIEKIRVAIKELNVPQDKNFSNLSPKELSDLIDNFKGNESLQDRIILAKYGAASVLADHYDKSVNLQMYKQLNEDRKSKVSKLSVLEERLAGPVDSTGKVIKSGQDRAKTRVQISELKDEISSIDDILKTGRQRADNVSAKAKSTEERVIANFRETKAEEKKL